MDWERRAIIVVSPPRAGSSCIAGALHNMGVYMGREFQQEDELNKAGYFEDIRWQGLAKLIFGSRYDLNPPDELSDEHIKMVQAVLASVERQGAPVWGFKSPRLSTFIHLVVPHIRDAGWEVKIIVAVRNIEEIAQSMERHSSIAYGGELAMGRDEAREFMRRWSELVLSSIHKLYVDKLYVSYNGLVKHPNVWIRLMASFIFNGTPYAPDVRAGVEFVDPAMRHFGG